MIGDAHSRFSNLNTIKRLFAFLLTKQLEIKPDLCCWLGDQQDTHAIIRAEVVDTWFKYLKNVSVPQVMLKGNHEEAYPGSPVHSLVAYRDYCRVVDFPYENGDILFLPYTNDINKFKQWLNQYPNKRLLFCHQTFDGAQYANGFYDPNGIPIEWVAGYDMVLVGHIHTAQSFANIWYPGTPFANSWNDADQEKGVWLFDTDTLAKQFIPTGLPEYKTLLVQSSQEIPSVLANLSKENHYKINIKSTRSDVLQFQDSQIFKELKNNYHLTLSPEYLDFQLEKVRIQDTLSPEKILVKYVEEFLNTSLNKNELIIKSLDYLAKG